MKTPKINKHYIQAYNNPNQYINMPLKETDDKKLLDYYSNISKGVTDALRDRQNGVYKFK